MCRGAAPSTPPKASFAQRLSPTETMEVPWQPNSSSPSTSGAPPEGRLPWGESLRAGDALPRQSPAPPPPPPLAQAEAQEEAQMTHVAHVAQPPCWIPALLGATRTLSTPPSAAAEGAPSAPSAAAPSAADGAPSVEHIPSMAAAAAAAAALLARSIAVAVAAAGAAADGMRGGRLTAGGVAPPFSPLRSACLAAVALTAACQDEVRRVAEALL